MLLSATSLTGNEVKNPAGESLGKVEDLMIEPASGTVAYSVISFGGVFGVFNKLFAVPLSAMSVDTDEKCFILDRDKATLEGAPGFDKDNWPDMHDVNWRRSVDTFYRTS